MHRVDRLPGPQVRQGSNGFERANPEGEADSSPADRVICSTTLGSEWEFSPRVFALARLISPARGYGRDSALQIVCDKGWLLRHAASDRAAAELGYRLRLALQVKLPRFYRPFP